MLRFLGVCGVAAMAGLAVFSLAYGQAFAGRNVASGPRQAAAFTRSQPLTVMPLGIVKCAKLASFDANRDGKVDAGDPKWPYLMSKLYVWVDRNADKKIAPSERLGLSGLGIQSFRVAGGCGSFTRTNGQTHQIKAHRSGALVVDLAGNGVGAFTTSGAWPAKNTDDGFLMF